MENSVVLGQRSKYDDPLMSVLQDCGKMELFLETIFSFLARRTDFYILMHHDKATMGFPPGVSESMLRQAFKKFEVLSRKRETEVMREAESKKLEEMTKAKAAENEGELPVVVPEEDGEEGKEKEGKGKEKGKRGGLEKVKPKVKSSEKVKGVKLKSGITNVDDFQTKKERASAFNEISDTYNGSQMDNYKWSQTITEVEVKVDLPDGTTAKNLRVDIRSEYLKVELLKPEYQVIMEGKLMSKVIVDESMWNVDRETSILCINLEKAKEIMWKSVLEGEEAIDLTQVENIRDISEFDEEAQAAIQRVKYDQHMKMQGKPTSGEKKAHDLLKKAWNAEGSPFKGTPFDPSKVQISGSW